eukprot:TRINITY_DN4590_c0_g2_i1.p1 TRINITY_DN4590_c0_g2~~TRINITY_DN4590_c0_g2_i1.p1  ORF type:complete len:1023 (-),score=187.66 TRINITY_DN4590_c0_g2_i1:6-3074(-)
MMDIRRAVEMCSTVLPQRIVSELVDTVISSVDAGETSASDLKYLQSFQVEHFVQTTLRVTKASAQATMLQEKIVYEVQLQSHEIQLTEQRYFGLLGALSEVVAAIRSRRKQQLAASGFKPTVLRLAEAFGLTERETDLLTLVVCHHLEVPPQLFEFGTRTYPRRDSHLISFLVVLGMEVAEGLEVIRADRKHMKAQVFQASRNTTLSPVDFLISVPSELAKICLGLQLSKGERLSIHQSLLGVLKDLGLVDELEDILPDEVPGPIDPQKQDQNQGINLLHWMAQVRVEDAAIADKRTITAEEPSEVRAFTTDLEFITCYCLYYAGKVKLSNAKQRVIEMDNEMASDGEASDNIYLQDQAATISKLTITVRERKQAISERLQRTVEAGPWLPRLERVAQTLGLDDTEKLIIVALLDQQLESQKTSILAQTILSSIFAESNERILARRYFYKSSKLARHHLLIVRNEDICGTFETTTVHVDRRFGDFLLGLDTGLAEIIEGSHLYTPTTSLGQVILPEATKELIIQAVSNFQEFQDQKAALGLDTMLQYGMGLILLFWGPSGTGKTLMANALATHLNKKVLLINFPTLGVKDAGKVLQLVFREALVNNALIFFDECEVLFESRDRRGAQQCNGITTLLTEMERFPGLIVLATNRPHVMDDAMRRRISLSIEFRQPDHMLRERIWKSLMPPDVQYAEDVNFRALSHRYEISGGFIKNAALAALREALTHGEKETRLSQSDFHHGCRLQLRGSLNAKSFYHKATPLAGFDQLRLPQATRRLLEDIVNAEKARNVLCGSWGFESEFANQGVSALFYGPPGTGKSQAALAVGFEVGQPLKVVNAAQLVSKYIGETSKNIEAVFDDARANNAVLLFDEAEGLFGSRHVGSGSTSRYANVDVGVLLYLMERFPGVVILIANRISDIDAAFFRRLKFQVEFDLPDFNLRQELWRALIPVRAPLADNVDFTRLAKLPLSGGAIRTAIIRASTRAAVRDSSEITMQDLLSAAHEEDEKGPRQRDVRNVGQLYQ